MTPNELGKLAEDLFEKALARRYQKTAFVQRFPDTADIRARFQGKTPAHLPKQPADFHVTIRDRMPFYAEVKGTSNKSSFPYSRLEKGQVSAMRKVVAASGQYDVFIFHVGKNLWYRIPGSRVLADLSAERKSFNFEKEGLAYLWKVGNDYGLITN